MDPTAPTTPTNVAPTPLTLHPPSSAALIASLILGITGLVANIVYIGFFVTLPGMILLLLTVIMGIIGFILAIKTKKTVPPNKKRRAGIILNSISVGMAIISIGGFGVIYIAGFLFTGGLSTSSAERQASVQQISEQKNFAVGETAHIGTWDVRITDVTRNYQPTAAEYTPSTRQKVTIPQENEEFVLVKGSFAPNSKTAAVQTESGTPSLNDYSAVSVSKGAIGLWDSRVTTKTASDFTILFRIEKGSDTLAMTVPITIYKSVSPIVGTEGMPNVQVVYTLDLV